MSTTNAPAPLVIAQPATVLAQSIVSAGQLPVIGVNPDIATASNAVGFIVTTAYDPSSVSGLVPVQGQLLKIVPELYNLAGVIGYVYGAGVGFSEFGMPNLAGATIVDWNLGVPESPATNPQPQGFPPSINVVTTVMGLFQGTPQNSVELSNEQLPPELGGSSAPISTLQYGQSLHLLIQAYGAAPDLNGLSASTVGMVCAYAGSQIPFGFLSCAGQILEIGAYQSLYEAIGNTYGGDAAAGTFALPNLTDRVVVAAGDDYELGSSVGNSEVTLRAQTVPATPSATSGADPISTVQSSLALNLLISTSGATSMGSSEEVLVGQVAAYAGRAIPPGWLLAQGQELFIADYPDLFAVLKNTYGGDGVYTFAVPDLRNQIIIGSGNGLQVGQATGDGQAYVLVENLADITVTTPGITISNDGSPNSANGTNTSMALNVSGIWPGAVVEFSSDGVNWSQTYETGHGTNLWVRQIDQMGQVSNAGGPVQVPSAGPPVTPTVIIHYTSPIESDGLGSSESTTVTGNLSVSDRDFGATLQYSTDSGVTWSERFEALYGHNAVLVRQISPHGSVSETSQEVSFELISSPLAPAAIEVSYNVDGGKDITVLTAGDISQVQGTDSVDTLIYGLQRSVVMPSTIENIVLTGLGAGNLITGNSASNQFDVREGDWVLDAGLGQDVVIVPGTVDQYLIEQSVSADQEIVTMWGPDGKVQMLGVERIQFADTELTMTGDTSVMNLYYLYETLLLRTPDFHGLKYWESRLNEGDTLDQVVGQFLDAPEFASRHGDPLSNLQLVQAAYLAILGRQADPDGQQYWVDALNSGSLTRQGVWLDMLFSTEAQSGNTALNQLNAADFLLH